MNKVTFEIREADEMWKEQYGEDTINLRVIENHESGRTHWTSLLLARPNAETIVACFELRDALESIIGDAKEAVDDFEDTHRYVGSKRPAIDAGKARVAAARELLDRLSKGGV